MAMWERMCREKHSIALRVVTTAQRGVGAVNAAGSNALDTKVAQQRDDSGRALECACELTCRVHVEPRRPTDENPFLLRELVAHVERVAIRHWNHVVHNRQVETAWDVALAHALNEERAATAQLTRSEIRCEHRAIRVSEQHLPHRGGANQSRSAQRDSAQCAVSVRTQRA